ncbi:MAG TPA: hypothetical protein PLX85_05005 [Dehalococcoidia bacterium]|nr:hypothetical protein [Dehalococcoidia bacterium]
MSRHHSSHEQTQYRRIVVKVGSNLLTGGGDRLDAHAMAGLVQQIASVRARGPQR